MHICVVEKKVGEEMNSRGEPAAACFLLKVERGQCLPPFTYLFIPSPLIQSPPRLQVWRHVERHCSEVLVSE